MLLDNQNTEGKTAEAIEEQTSKIPSDVYLYAIEIVAFFVWK